MDIPQPCQAGAHPSTYGLSWDQDKLAWQKPGVPWGCEAGGRSSGAQGRRRCSVSAPAETSSPHLSASTPARTAFLECPQRTSHPVLACSKQHSAGGPHAEHSTQLCSAVLGLSKPGCAQRRQLTWRTALQQRQRQVPNSARGQRWRQPNQACRACRRGGAWCGAAPWREATRWRGATPRRCCWAGARNTRSSTASCS